MRHINRAVVQYAEDLIFASAASEGIESLVKKYPAYRVNAKMETLHTESDQGTFHVFGIRVCKR